MKFVKSLLRSLYVLSLGLFLFLVGLFARPDVVVERAVIHSTKHQQQPTNNYNNKNECDESTRASSNNNHTPNNITAISLVVLSDFHFGATPFVKITQKHLQKVVEQTNALQPDLVLLLGILSPRFQFISISISLFYFYLFYFFVNLYVNY
jgi:hypothetical protein